MSARDGELNFLHKQIEVLNEDMDARDRYHERRRDRLEGALLAIGCLTSEMAPHVRKAVEEIIALAKPTRPVEPELESPDHRPKEVDELKARDFERVNRSMRPIEPEGGAK